MMFKNRRKNEKVLVISGHPDLENSTANKAIIESLTKKMPEITIHRLDKAIKNDNFDIEKEQEQLLQYDTYVFVSPFHWFYCSSLMKNGLIMFLVKAFSKEEKLKVKI